MNSNMFRVNVSDLAKGLSLAVIVVVLGALQEAVTAHGFNIASYDWGAILTVAWQAGVAYIGKNFISDSNGKVLGRIG